MARRASAGWLAGAGLLLALAACGSDEGTPAPRSTEAAEGTWQRTVPDVSERSLRIFDDGSWEDVTADFETRTCTTAAGTWSVSDGVLQLTTRQVDGEPVSPVTVQGPFQISDGSLVWEVSGETAETFRPLAVVPTCPDYGWIDLVLTADIDGVTRDFSADPTTLVLESEISDGFLEFSGRFEPEGSDPATCDECDVLTLRIFTELGLPLTTGSYPVEGFGPSGLRGAGVLSVDVGGSGPTFGTNESDPSTQPWEGEIVVTTLAPQLAEGSFSFLLYDGDAAGPPYPVVSVTEGTFRISYD